MKKIFLSLYFAIHVFTSAFGQIKVTNLPATTTGTNSDFLIKDDAAGVGGSTKKITVGNFISTYSLTTAGTITGTAPIVVNTNTITCPTCLVQGANTYTSSTSISATGGLLFTGTINRGASYVARSLIDKGYADSLKTISAGLTLAQVLANGRNVDATGTINDNSSNKSIDIKNRGAYKSGGGNVKTFDWQLCLLNDASGIVSVDAQNRLLSDAGTNASLDYQNRLLIKNDGVTTAIDYQNLLLPGNWNATSAFKLGVATSTLGTLTFMNASTSFSVTVEAGNTTPASYILKLPLAQGAATTILKNDGAGNLSWGQPSNVWNLDGINSGASHIIGTTDNNVWMLQQTNSLVATTMQGGTANMSGLVFGGSGVYNGGIGFQGQTSGFVYLKCPTTITTYTMTTPSAQGAANQGLSNDGSGNLSWVSFGTVPHTIFTPLTGASIVMINKNVNIVSPAGTIATLTITFPDNPANNDFVRITFDQIVTSVTYASGAGGSTIKGQINGVVGGQKEWNYDSGTNIWY
jgi:hypothetical protein